jgi:WD40 repeat protein
VLVCRLTAGPPARPTPTTAPVTPPGPTVAPRSLIPLPGGTVLPSPTPLRQPTPSQALVLPAVLPEGLPAITPENIPAVRRLARLAAASALPFADIDFSPDGLRLAAITCYQTVQLWNPHNGQAVLTQPGPGSNQCSPDLRLDFSPAWQLFATSGNVKAGSSEWGVVRLWPLESETTLPETYTLTATRKSVTAIAFSPDGRLLAAGTSEFDLKLWYVPGILAGKPPPPGQLSLAPLLADLPHDDWVVDIAFSPDGTLLAAATALTEDGQTRDVITLWDLASLYTAGEESVKVVRVLRAGHGPLWQVAFSPDGQLLAGAGGGLTLWQVASGDQYASLDLPLAALAFAPGSEILAAAGGDSLILWNYRGEQAQGTPAPADLVRRSGAGDLVQLVFSPDGRALASLSDGGVADLWGVLP